MSACMQAWMDTKPEWVSGMDVVSEWMYKSLGTALVERFPRRWIDSRSLDIIIQDIPPPLFYPFDTVHLVAVSSDVIVIFNLITTTSERRREIDSPLCNSHSYSADFSVLTHLISSHSHTIHPPRNLPPLRRDTSDQPYNQTRRLGTRV